MGKTTPSRFVSGVTVQRITTSSNPKTAIVFIRIFDQKKENTVVGRAEITVNLWPDRFNAVATGIWIDPQFVARGLEQFLVENIERRICLFSKPGKLETIFFDEGSQPELCAAFESVGFVHDQQRGVFVLFVPLPPPAWFRRAVFFVYPQPVIENYREGGIIPEVRRLKTVFDRAVKLLAPIE